MMMKEVPIAIELDTANANPMYLSPGETDEMISSEPLIALISAGTVKKYKAVLSPHRESTESSFRTCLNARTRMREGGGESLGGRDLVFFEELRLIE